MPLEEPYATPRHTVPIQRTSFVGRESELVEIRGDLAMTRLLTLTGAGGTGKTRLALELAEIRRAHTGRRVAGGARAPFGTRAGDSERLPESLGVREQPGLQLGRRSGRPARKELLISWITANTSRRRSPPGGRLGGRLSQGESCATSRETLRVPGETIRLLSPLSVPDSSEDAEGIARHGAVRLFVERVRLRLPAFEITPQNTRVIVELCRKLDGIPLALELAAARAGTLAMEQVAQRLEDSLAFLNTGRGRPRQGSEPARLARVEPRTAGRTGTQTLREARGFRRGLHPGGCGGRVPRRRHRRRRRPGVVNLVDKSLVVAETTAAGGVRYRMLEPVGSTPQKLEESEEAETVRYRHAAFFLAAGRKGKPELTGPGQVEWLGRLEEDKDNLRAAMAWLLERGEVETVVRMGWALWIFWLIHTHMDEGAADQAALAMGENLTGQRRAQALWVQASTYYGRGSPEQIERMCEEAAALFRQRETNTAWGTS